MMSEQVGRESCVVLNNQHEARIEEFAEINSSEPGRTVLFQPYTDTRLQSVKALLDEADGPVPLFLVAGRFGEAVSAMGLLNAIEFSDEIPQERKAEIGKWASKADEPPVYALNVLFASNVIQLRNPVSLDRFVKRSNSTPLASGSWTASVCYSPDLVEVISAL